MTLNGNLSTAAPPLNPDEFTGTSLHRAIQPPQAPAAAFGYSPGVAVEGRRILFISGQGPEDLDADIETQIRQTFDRIGAILQAEGATFANVTMLRSYFVHLLRDLPVFRQVRREYLQAPFPASTSVGVSELAIPRLDIEIEAIAVL